MGDVDLNDWIAPNVGEVCSKCGAKVKAPYEVPLSRNAISSLLAIFRGQGDKSFVTTEDIYKLIKKSSATAEVVRLRYLGAVRPFYTENDFDKESKRSGKWCLTEKAKGFLKGKDTLPSKVVVHNGEVVKKEEEWFINNKKIKWKTEDDIWKDLKSFWDSLKV